MPRITDYDTLRTEVARWTHRDDLSDDIPTFIQLAEDRISYDLHDLAAMHATVEATMNTSASFLSLAAVDPLLFVLRYARYSGDNHEPIAVSVPSKVIAHQYSTGRPSRVAIYNNRLNFDRLPQEAYPFVVAYSKRVDPLNETTTTNWVLEQAPAMYLYAALLESVGLTHDDEREGTWQTRYEQALSKFRNVSHGGDVLANTDLPSSRGGYNINTDE